MGARPVGIEWPHDRCRQSVRLTVDLRVGSARELGSAIAGSRCAPRRLLGEPLASAIAINLRRRAIKKQPNPLLARLLEHNQRASRVDLVVLDRPAERTTNTLDGEMEYPVTAAHRQFDCGGVENGALDNAQLREACDFSKILTPPSGEIIEHGHRFATPNQPVDGRRDQENATPGGQAT